MNGFGTEFYTTDDGRHRVEISVRDGYPMKYHRFLCEIMAMYLRNCHEWARIVSLFDNDTYGSICFTVASDNPDDAEISIDDELQKITGGGMIGTRVEIIEKGPVHSDHYDQMEYLRRKVIERDKG